MDLRPGEVMRKKYVDVGGNHMFAQSIKFQTFFLSSRVKQG